MQYGTAARVSRKKHAVRDSNKSEQKNVCRTERCMQYSGLESDCAHGEENAFPACCRLFCICVGGSCITIFIS